eukprot:TRINITY_DN5187_c0_g1_i4.p1 TRINITY_DN5187_c0_g1~~TRINITY_DN5187_c0_g1_i4.p1  ORF type:complete len:779 (+),score=279.26 TRINITY_DN5187_c0_g1_i4:52-2388(+)
MSDIFDGLVICASGTLSLKKAEFKELIEENGGKVADNFTNSVTHIISTDSDVEKRTTKIKKGIEKNIPILSEDWVNASIKKGSLESKTKYLLHKEEDGDDEKDDQEEKPEKNIKKRKIVSEEKGEVEEKKSTKKSKNVEEEKDEEGSDLFDGLVICLSGKLSKTVSEWKTLITSNGGEIASSVTKSCTHLVTNASEVEKETKKVKDAFEKKLPIVDEQWLIDSENLETLADISSYLIDISSLKSSKETTTTKKTTTKKSSKDAEEIGDEEEPEKKSIVKKKILTIKSGAPVEEMSGKESTHHVYQENGEFWNCMLNQTNTKNNNNKYYKIQLLESDSGSGYYVFTKWGRVGEERKSNTRCDAKSTIKEAKAFFGKKFKEKTGNTWDDRENFEFVKGKYLLIEMDYGQDDEGQVKEEIIQEEVEDDKEVYKSKLDDRVQDFIKLIFDIKMMTNTLVQMEFDITKSPLGKLKKSQILQGYEILRKIEDQLNANKKNKLHDLTDDFYNHIPHKFGRSQKPILIGDMEILKQKLQLLDALSEIEVATKILKAPKLSEHLSQVDDHYDKLNCEITALDKSSEEFNRISLYLQNSQHKDTHHKRLELLDVFKVKKPGEEERFKTDIGNRKLLWHGSRLSNYVGILSTGLRIAPKEAPTTGYRFGKGIYFADVASLSSKYCYVDKSNPTGVLILCDVALGKPFPAKKDIYMDEPKKGYDSTWALGTIEPNEKDNVTTEEGVVIPSGKIVKSQYKEGEVACYEHQYVTYDVAQSKIQYLLKVKYVF